MGLSLQSTQKNVLNENKEKIDDNERVIALAGNPNVGKSTVFNALTGLKQHTGNWAGKTVANAVGHYTYDKEKYTVVDLPGTYSLIPSSKEEEISGDFICSKMAKTVVIVADATCLERNLNLVLQILEITPNCILCVNLMDEAKKRNIHINLNLLSKILKIPVVGISASKKKGVTPLLNEIKNAVENPCQDICKVRYDSIIESSIKEIIKALSSTQLPDGMSPRFIAIRLLCGDKRILKQAGIENDAFIKTSLKKEKSKLESYGVTESNISDKVTASIVMLAEKIADKCVIYKNGQHSARDRKIDKIITSKSFGIPIMLCLIGFIFYLSIIGANYPSALLSALFLRIEVWLVNIFKTFNSPQWLYNLLVTGVFGTLSRVISVMLPPMAIFFPLFTLLEDLGYLPRMAFNLDGIFQKCHAHGKQCLTMCMGLGCNAAGVTGTRIIDSPKERLIAIITNNFMPCNGRFPLLIAISGIFFANSYTFWAKSAVSAFAILAILIAGVIATFIISYFLSVTVLKCTPSQFTLELPPYRKPKIGEVIYRSIFDRTLFVLARAAAIAAPFGAIIWLTANVQIGSESLLSIGASFLDPFARVIGLDGYILLSFILGIPANEIVLPILLMCYTAAGELVTMETLPELGALLVSNGWTVITAINVMIFTLFHFPCSTTLMTIYKETKSIKWTFLSFLLPTAVGVAVCFAITQLANIFA